MTNEATDINLPGAKRAIVGEFEHRDAAERVIEALLQAGFTDDQLSLVARGAHGTPSGEFIPGSMVVTVRDGRRTEDAERILREHEALRVHADEVSATGEIDDARELTR